MTLNAAGTSLVPASSGQEAFDSFDDESALLDFVDEDEEVSDTTGAFDLDVSAFRVPAAPPVPLP